MAEESTPPLNLDRLKNVFDQREDSSHGLLMIRNRNEPPRIVIDDHFSVTDFIQFIKDCHACLPPHNDKG
jgi:hypothetical protein